MNESTWKLRVEALRITEDNVIARERRCAIRETALLRAVEEGINVQNERRLLDAVDRAIESLPVPSSSVRALDEIGAIAAAIDSMRKAALADSEDVALERHRLRIWSEQLHAAFASLNARSVELQLEAKRLSGLPQAAIQLGAAAASSGGGNAIHHLSGGGGGGGSTAFGGGRGGGGYRSNSSSQQQQQQPQSHHTQSNNSSMMMMMDPSLAEVMNRREAALNEREKHVTELFKYVLDQRSLVERQLELIGQRIDVLGSRPTTTTSGHHHSSFPAAMMAGGGGGGGGGDDGAPMVWHPLLGKNNGVNQNNNDQQQQPQPPRGPDQTTAEYQPRVVDPFGDDEVDDY